MHDKLSQEVAYSDEDMRWCLSQRQAYAYVLLEKKTTNCSKVVLKELLVKENLNLLLHLLTALVATPIIIIIINEYLEAGITASIWTISVYHIY